MTFSPAMAFDPKCPSALLLPTIKSSDSSEQGVRVDRILADDGVGCNSYERAALLKLIAAQAKYYKPLSSNNDSIKELCRTYLQALNECLEGWEGDEALTDDAESIEALKIVYAVTQLSSIYLLLPAGDSSPDDLWSMPGAVTADTVRYLRFHHMSDPFEVVGDGLEDMLESTQPEQFGAPYWKLVQTLVLRGCLDDAWNLISRHSLFRRCFEKTEILDEYHQLTIEQDKEGFRVLQSLLLSAPLPGGRSEWNDSGLDGNDDDDQELDDHTLLLDGVPRDAYKLWDPNWSVDEDGPLSFNPHAAMSTTNAWRRAVIDNASLHGLVRRIPQLQTNVINILAGKLDVVVFDSWSQALCAELLYQRPNLRPMDMNVRAESAMKNLGAPVATGFDQVVLSVMKGDAGRSLEVLYNLGGSSGAALPATMTSLLCNILTETEQIPQSTTSSSSFQTELLLSASEALLSSLATSEDDLGVSLSTQLLLPFTKPNGDVRVLATLGETLERHGPTTDAEARALLDLTRDLVARKSRRILSGCVNLVRYRYQFYLKKRMFDAATHWLLKGIELEVLLYATDPKTGRRDDKAWEIVNASGVFGTLLCSSCLDVSKSLLMTFVGSEKDDENTSAGLDFSRAREMVDSIKEDDPSGLAHMIPDVKLLVLVFETAQSIIESKGDVAIAKNIVACLEENAGADDSGFVAPLAHAAMYPNLLLLAYSILQRDEAHADESGQYKSQSSFDVQGMRMLMTKFVEVDKKWIAGSSALPEESEMRLALGKGLERAIVAENAKRQEFGLRKPHGSLGSAHSSKLSSYNPSEQEKIVQLMLAPSMQ